MYTSYHASYRYRLLRKSKMILEYNLEYIVLELTFLTLYIKNNYLSSKEPGEKNLQRFKIGREKDRKKNIDKYTYSRHQLVTYFV